MTDSDALIPVTVIGGYLGAGKTTLLNHILRNADERIAVLVNDFGDINIDAALVDSADGDTISLANGCICCSMVDGFIGALETVKAQSPSPQRLVVEASGVADPQQIAAYAHMPGLVLDGTIVVVDADQVPKQLRNEYIRDVVEQQLRAADLLVLNKRDLVADADRVSTSIGSISDAPQLSAVNGELPLEVLLGIEVLERDAAPGPVADDRFGTWSESFAEPVDRAELVERLEAQPDSVVRVKGFVRLNDAPELLTIVHRVGERLALSPGGPWDGSDCQLVFVELRSKNSVADVTLVTERG